MLMTVKTRHHDLWKGSTSVRQKRSLFTYGNITNYVQVRRGHLNMFDILKLLWWIRKVEKVVVNVCA